MDTADALRRSSSSSRRTPLTQIDSQNTCSLPKDHIGPADTAQSQDSATLPESHTLGHSQPAQRTNRFSLTFPILPASKETSPTRSPSSGNTHDSAIAGSSEWLTAIAAQERRVLEIKEELHKAEAELNKLKLQWTTHEAQKKKNEAKKTTKLRPLSTMLPATDKEDVTGSNAWLQHEMERRKTLMSGARSSSRRVFSGSKHTRTLSLLSPVHTASNQTLPQHRPRGATSPAKGKDKLGEPKPQALPRAATTPNFYTDPDNADIKIDLSGIDKDVLLQTGKKMAMDLKDGIWTFWEDLRQATVGEDMVQVVPPTRLHHQSSNQTLRTPRRGGNKSSVRGSSRGSNSSRASITRSPLERRPSPQKGLPIFDEAGVDQGTIQPAARRSSVANKRSCKHIKTPSLAVSAASSDAFDAWDDSPRASLSSSVTSESTSRPSPVGSKDTSPIAKADAARDPIPWPNIAKFGPATLRRTASHLMSEWDKLSPPPREGSSDYLEVKAPTEVDKGKKQD